MLLSVLAILAATAMLAEACPATGTCPDCTCAAATKTYTCLNALTSVPVCILADALILEIDDNLLGSIDESTFAGVTDLKELDLDSNGISAIADNSFADLSQLVVLDLAINDLESIRASMFTGLVELDDLSVSRNLITEIDATTFASLSKLTYLSLRSNVITSIADNAFISLALLEELHLYSNQLTTITALTFKGLVALIELSLYNNPITVIAKDAFNDMSALEELKLYGAASTISIPSDLFPNGATNSFCTSASTCPVSTCETKCGVDSFCIGDWNSPSDLQCVTTTTTSTTTTTTTTSTTTTTTTTTTSTTTTTAAAATTKASGWFVAQPSQSCTTACLGKQPCNSAQMKRVTSAATFKAVAAKAGVTKSCPFFPRSTATSFNPTLNGKNEPCNFQGQNSGCKSVPTNKSFRRVCCCALNAASCPLN